MSTRINFRSLTRACRVSLLSLIAIALCIVLLGCNIGNDDNAIETPVDNDKVFSEPVDISIIIGSHASWPFQSDWLMWQYFEEALGANLRVEALSNYDLDRRISLMVASHEKMPDLINVTSKSFIDKHAASGAFIDINSNMDKLPHFKSFLASLNPLEAQEILQRNVSSGQSMLLFPNHGFHTMNNLRTWMYRKDIFEKNNLSPPKTIDELYETCKELKRLYPASFPLSMRSGGNTINVIAPQWKPYFNAFIYYDFNADKWCLGAAEDTMKEIIVFFNKLYREKLIPPDFFTINIKSWEQLVNTDRGFIMPEYILRIDYFNKPNRMENPDYTWAFMPPPKVHEAVTPRLAKTNWDSTGYVVCNTRDSHRIENAFKLVDWMYSPNGIELLSWGKEGETFETLEDGKRRFISDDKGTTPRNLYGVGTYGLYQAIDPASNESMYSDENVAAGKKALQYSEDKINPANWVPLNIAETSIKNQYYDSLNKYCETGINGFITGELSLSEWDAFREGIKEYGADALLSVYDSAYRRVKP